MAGELSQAEVSLLVGRAGSAWAADVADPEHAVSDWYSSPVYGRVTESDLTFRDKTDRFIERYESGEPEAVRFVTDEFGTNVDRGGRYRVLSVLNAHVIMSWAWVCSDGPAGRDAEWGRLQDERSALIRQWRERDGK